MSAGVIAYLPQARHDSQKIEEPQRQPLSVQLTIMAEVPETHVLAVASHVRERERQSV
jgi:hypothetical protein